MKTFLSAVLVCAVLTGCGPRPAQEPAPASAQFLIEAAARDFQRHVAPTGARFRNVHAGEMTGANSARVQLLCGEFSAPPEDAWTPFATIRTSDYENWIGESATTYCRADTTRLNGDHDFAEALAEHYRAAN